MVFYTTTRRVGIAIREHWSSDTELNLNYIGDHVGPDALAVVRSLPALQELKIGSSVGFQNYHHLAGHPNLRKLDLGAAHLTKADVAFLPSLPKLAFVEIRLNNLEDASAVEATLKRCPKLKGARI